MDGIRIVSPDICDLLQKVPGAQAFDVSQAKLETERLFQHLPYLSSVLDLPLLLRFCTTRGRASLLVLPKRMRAFVQYDLIWRKLLMSVLMLRAKSGSLSGNGNF